MRTWMKLAPAVLLLLPFAPAASGADPEPDTAQQIKQLQTDVAALRQHLENLQNEVRANSVRGAQTALDIREIKDLLQRMAGAQTTTRYYGPPSEGGPAVASPTTAMITVRNQYTANATIRINGRSYPVAPGQELRVPGVPLGSINYDVEVDGYGLVQPLRTETLRPNGRIITIFPQFGG